MNPQKPNGPLIDRATLEAISSLTIEVRRVVEGLQGGGHRSLHLGASVEFAEHKKYYPGDDIRDLDWRVFARTDRYFIKQHEREVTLHALMLLDCSPSMGYMGIGTQKSKFEYASVLIGAMSHILISQGDEVGLKTFADSTLAYLPPAKRPEHLASIIKALVKSETAESGLTNYREVISGAANRAGRRAMFVFVTDLWGATRDTELDLMHLADRGHDVIVFRILTPDELDFPFANPARFVGLEGEPEIEADPSMIRAAYRRQIEEKTGHWIRFCNETGIDFIPVSTTEKPEVILSGLAARRHRGGGRRA